VRGGEAEVCTNKYQKLHLWATNNPSERPNRDDKESNKETEKGDDWNDENSYGDPLDGSMEMSGGWDMFIVGSIFDEGSSFSFCHFGCV
jgi:hypothetical protein